MSNLAIWSNLVCLIIGCAIGYVLGKRENMKMDKADPGGKKKRDKRNSSWWIGAAMIIAAVYIVITTSVTNSRVEAGAREDRERASAQAVCNKALIEAINQRAKINAQDLDLNRSDDAALRTFVSSVVTAPPEDLVDPDATFLKLRTYNQVLNDNAEVRERLDRERAASPYPSPDCGEG